MHIADILEEKGHSLITVRATAPLREAIALLDRERIGALAVLNDENQLVGVLSERDLITVLAEYGDRAMMANVGALMSHRVYLCTPDDPVAEALAWMVHFRVRHLPVVEDGRLRGVVSIGDLVKHTVDETDTQPAILKDPVFFSPADS